MKLAFVWRALALACTLACALGAAPAARAAGTTPLALVQQFDQSGQPLAGCLVYFYVAGTVATPQQVYQDFGLTQTAPNPLQCDQSARVPQHWLADGLTHVRLTSAAGVVQLDSTLQVLGPSSGGGGGGGGTTVDPTAVASTGDVKFRFSGETLIGWVQLNAQTIGSATSGATQRANADTQALFVYLWGQCDDSKCPVPGGRGLTALADFNGNKQITLPDMRGKLPVGRDCMGTTCAGVLLASNITSGGSDGVDTPGAGGGQSNQTAKTTLAPGNIPGLSLSVSTSVSVSGANHSHGFASGSGYVMFAGAGFSLSSGGIGASIAGSTAASGTLSMSGTGVGQASCNNCGGQTATSASFAAMPPFRLATFYIKL
jgi:hypothetical protein